MINGAFAIDHRRSDWLTGSGHDTVSAGARKYREQGWPGFSNSRS